MSRDEKRVCVMRNRESDGKRFGGERFRDRYRERYIGGISNNSETEVIQREWDRESEIGRMIQGVHGREKERAQEGQRSGEKWKSA